MQSFLNKSCMQDLYKKQQNLFILWGFRSHFEMSAFYILSLH